MHFSEQSRVNLSTAAVVDECVNEEKIVPRILLIR